MSENIFQHPDRRTAIIVSWGCSSGMDRENLCPLGKSDRGVLDAAPCQLWATCMLRVNGTQPELGFLPDHQALTYGVGMQPEGLTDVFERVQCLVFSI